MDENHIKRFNDARMFLFLNGYLAESENKRVKIRFEKAAKKKGVELISKSVFER